MSEKKYTGTLKVYDAIKGFGFISREQGRDVFVYYEDFTDKNTDASAMIGCIVSFELYDPISPKGPKAKNVSIIS
ncbi:cold shock domain-containing protein [Iodobacter sp. HSC-16F04]|uniref:Cold shock domain-containing protein n=1 Tax=Iodobacter violaceini TaxID=3044271 RepID=A0ABX0KS37_9NEIS|nr:cold shock domain-containing protein [Iodobacter violacea]NHQ85267.1 cold shock domain-containing protein [Iodobacter violacea]